MTKVSSGIIVRCVLHRFSFFGPRQATRFATDRRADPLRGPRKRQLAPPQMVPFFPGGKARNQRCEMARFGPDTQEIQLDVAVRWPRSGEWPHRRWCPSFRVGKLEIKDATWRDLDLTLRRFNWTSQYGGREAASGPTAGGRWQV